MQVCTVCHSQVDSNGEHYHMTKCVGKELKELREFRDLAFQAHPNIDIDIEHINTNNKQT